MKCPACKDKDLIEVMTSNGVLIDLCSHCQGIWLDKGEIFYFTKAPLALSRRIAEALKNSKPSERVNPRTKSPLVEIGLLGGKLLIDYCPETGGIWLDKGELEQIPKHKGLKLKIIVDKKINSELKPEVRQKRALEALPNLGLISGITLFSLYALLSIILITLVSFGFTTSGFAIVIGIIFAGLQFGLSPFIMDLSLRWFYKARWTPVDELPSNLKTFISEISGKHKIKIPRIGIIPDGSPNAFTYGHTPNNARMVLTSGIMDLLEEKELEAVVAHEVGHIVHWDMLIMTVAYLVPLILYYIFRTLIRIRSRGKDQSAPYRYAIAIAAYILYIISEYIVLWFSRVREYFADRFSGQNSDPNQLAQALVKIGYGLAGKEKSKDSRNDGLESVKAMGVFDPQAARALAISGYHPQSMGGDVDKESLKGAMKWDLWNPWAMYYELHSTHPLIAKRLLALSKQAVVGGKAPYIEFTELKPESYWDEFFVDLAVSSGPAIVVVSTVILSLLKGNLSFVGFGVLLLGAAKGLKTLFSYNFSFFPQMNISSLLKKVKVSGVRPVPCVIEGKLIGRGVPGLIWSEDFVLQDKTGIIFLDYRQPLAIWNFLFGALRAKKYIGQEVKITGWYRRSPVPYIEIKTLETSTGKTACFVFNLKVAVAIILAVGGLVLMVNL